MKYTDLINNRVHTYYWIDDLNCAQTTLKTLAEIFNVHLSSQVIDSATGLLDKGMFGAHCGLVQGTKMFIGIVGQERGLDTNKIIELSQNFSKKFQDKFGSLTCSDLRPQGFTKENPPHLCEEITKEAINFSANFLLAVD